MRARARWWLRWSASRCGGSTCVRGVLHAPRCVLPSRVARCNTLRVARCNTLRVARCTLLDVQREPMRRLRGDNAEADDDEITIESQSVDHVCICECVRFCMSVCACAFVCVCVSVRACGLEGGRACICVRACVCAPCYDRAVQRVGTAPYNVLQARSTTSPALWRNIGAESMVCVYSKAPITSAYSGCAPRERRESMWHEGPWRTRRYSVASQMRTGVAHGAG